MNEKILSTLRELDLTQSEAKIYLAVLESGKTTISEIAKKTQLHRRNIYDCLSTLLDKGLVFNILGEQQNFYGSITPEKLIELIESKEIALNAILPSLQELYTKEHVLERALIYKGVEGFKRYLQDILNVGKDVHCIGAKGGWASANLGDFAQWFEEERMTKNMKVFNLFDAEMREKVTQEKPLYTKFAEYRFLPAEYSTASAIDIFGDHVVIFTGLQMEKIDDHVTLFVIINSDLADSYRIWFQCMWDYSSI